MNRNQIVRTAWAKRFKANDPGTYAYAIKLACERGLVFEIVRTNESGPWLWVIAHRGFWMDGFKTQKAAVDLCKRMGWKYEVQR
jgi:hypothetical protein